MRPGAVHWYVGAEQRQSCPHLHHLCQGLCAAGPRDQPPGVRALSRVVQLHLYSLRRELQYQEQALQAQL